MGEMITKTYYEKAGGATQCDIIRDIEYIEYAKEEGNTIAFSKIIFPLAIILTQACDLTWDYNAREKVRAKIEGNDNLQVGANNKYLISVIVAPIYSVDEFFRGTHLSQLGMSMQDMENFGNKDNVKFFKDNIQSNRNERYHYLKFDNKIIKDGIIDFKHYFTVTASYLNSIYEENYLCSIESVYREQILQRFSNFLSRIGLPDPVKKSSGGI